VVLSTWDDNHGAIALYRSIGFVDIPPFKPPTFPNMAFMGFALTPSAAEPHESRRRPPAPEGGGRAAA